MKKYVFITVILFFVLFPVISYAKGAKEGATPERAEFLVSGEALLRNLLMGKSIADEFGPIMNVGYIPDPFGHIGQLPQIWQGCEIPSMLFMRGFGNECEENNLNMEFISWWQHQAGLLTFYMTV